MTTVRRALRGETHKRGRMETRGRKTKLTAVKLQALDRARKKVAKKVKGEAEVHMKDLMKEARVTNVHETTVSKAFRDTLGIAWRTPRPEPLRNKAEEEGRVAVCKKWKRLPNNYFLEKIDAIIDNKVFPIPTYEKAKVYARKTRVRGTYRTRGDGVQKEFTKPKGNQNRVNPGARVNVAAAIINGKV